MIILSIYLQISIKLSIWEYTARAVCRRAERQLVGLSKEISINEVSLKFLNRLSDLLFVFARTLARSEGGEEIYWQSDRLKE